MGITERDGTSALYRFIVKHKHLMDGKSVKSKDHSFPACLHLSCQMWSSLPAKNVDLQEPKSKKKQARPV